MENELRKLLAEVDSKAKELNDLIGDFRNQNDLEDYEDDLLYDINDALERIEAGITKYQQYKKWI